MKPPKKTATPAKPELPITTRTLTELVQYSAKLIVEKQALRAVLEKQRVSNWRDEYSREFQERWENQGTAFETIHAYIREKRVAAVLSNLRKVLGSAIDPD